MSRFFLSHIRIDSFGAFSNRVVGPLAQGLNIVFGRNEAGKSTVAAFLCGVLFGWEEARGRKNTYKPAAAERAGALVFAPRLEGERGNAKNSADEADGAGERELYRSRNADGLQGDASLVADIDKATFRTVFSFTSDELRSLRNASDVTAKLLTAGSGTEASPAHALEEIGARIAERTSHAAAATESLTNLAAEKDRLREEMANAEREAERYKRQSNELAEMEPQRREMAERIATVNDEIESLTAARATVTRIDERIADLAEERAAVVEALAADEGTGEMPDAPDIAASDELAIRDALDIESEASAKREHALEHARDTYGASKARFEALLEAEDSSARTHAAARQRAMQIIVSVALPVVFVVTGIPLFLHGRTMGSWSFSILGAMLVAGAVVLGGASIVLMFRPNKTEEEWEVRKQDLHWTMLQDKKLYEQLASDAARADDRVREYLGEVGLGAAEGSLRRARQLLDEASAARSARQTAEQRRKAREVRLSSLDDALAAARAERARVCIEVGADAHATTAALEREAERRMRQRDELLEANGRMERRLGELSTELAQAKHLREFDRIKLDYQQVCTRFNESAAEFAKLLVARRMMETAVATWGSKSQPEVYRQASGLLARMTDGAWTHIELMPDGRLSISDAAKRSLDPTRLSLSTCQQVYLSLRIALLLAADNVGRSVPVVADDILVHFDSTRRRAAAAALAELSRQRQVIVLTCHEEVVEALRASDPGARVIGL